MKRITHHLSSVILLAVCAQCVHGQTPTHESALPTASALTGAEKIRGTQSGTGNGSVNITLPQLTTYERAQLDSVYAPAVHVHAISDVTGLQSAINGKVPGTRLVNGHALSGDVVIDYADLTGKPTLFDGTWSSLSGKPSFATVATSGSYADLLNKPTLFDGTWSSLSGKPSFATVATSGSYADLLNKPALFDGTWSSLSGKPSFATVATSGSYADLSSRPTLGTAAAKDAPASGNAATGQLVMGSDTRLTDARAPTAHAASHASGGTDPITLDESQVNNLTTDLAGKLATNGDASGLTGSPTFTTINGYTPGSAMAATLDTDGTAAANSNGNVMSQAAVVTYIAAHAGGVPLGGTTNQVLRKIDDTDGNAGWVTVTDLFSIPSVPSADDIATAAEKSMGFGACWTMTSASPSNGEVQVSGLSAGAPPGTLTFAYTDAGGNSWQSLWAQVIPQVGSYVGIRYTPKSGSYANYALCRVNSSAWDSTNLVLGLDGSLIANFDISSASGSELAITFHPSLDAVVTGTGWAANASAGDKTVSIGDYTGPTNWADLTTDGFTFGSDGFVALKALSDQVTALTAKVQALEAALAAKTLPNN